MATKTVYQCDEDGYFGAETVADPDPLDPGRWLIPGGCVEVAPPALLPDEKAHWDGTSWTVVKITDPNEAQIYIDAGQARMLRKNKRVIESAKKKHAKGDTLGAIEILSGL